MSTVTPNYGFILPSVNSPSDEDLWGGELNQNWTSLDTLLLTTLQPADTQFIVHNATDATKKARFNLSNVLAGTTAIYLMPAGNTALVGTDTTDTLTNKSIAASQLRSATLASGVGFSATSNGLGVITSGTVTPAAANGNFQHYNNNGAHTLAPPTTVCSIIIQIFNNTSAGAISTGGFTKVAGDALTNVNGSKFQLSIVVTNDFSSLTVLALQ